MSANPTSEIPESFICALTQDLMKDPVIDPEGHTYERTAIEKWLEDHSTSPITRSPLSLSELVPNRALQDSIEQWLQSNNPQPRQHAPQPAPQEQAPAPEQPMPEDNDIAVAISANVGSNDLDVPVLVSLKPPTGLRRTPIDICCVIDVSGSMGSEARVPGQSGAVESHGLSYLDIVKHAVKTIIQVLTPADRIALVSFSSTAKTVLKMKNMDANGKKTAETALSGMRPDASTNIWDGLHSGLEMIRNSDSSHERVAAVLLLTDGQPNIIPPRGHLPMLQRYIDQHSPKCTINTFGFGYDLDSKLLEELAIAGNGTYAFIPDSNFVGTTFVNFTSNLLAVAAKNVSITLESLNGAKVLDQGVLGGYPTQYTSWGAQLHLGQIQYGQTKDIVVRMSMPDAATDPYLSVSLTYETGRSNSPRKVTAQSADRQGSIEVEVQRIRLLFVDSVCEAMKKGSANDLKTAQNIISDLIKDILASEAKNEPRIVELLKDAQGQVTEALSRADWFKKWGRHYLPSLMRAHLLQQCNNFKDPGVQVYGSTLFTNLRDQADDIFCKLPPPKPSLSRSGSRSSNTIVNMRQYNYSGNPCFGGDCQVQMADGTLKRVNQIAKGDSVHSPEGASTSVQVLCVVKTRCQEGKAQLVELDGGLVITPWHPLCIVDGHSTKEWQFPCEVKPASVQPCPFVYSFVLSEGHVMVINGVHCVTLGHNFKGDKREHAYFGSDQVVDDLRKLAGWNAGLVELEPGCLKRDSKTGLVCKLEKGHAQEAAV